MTTFRQHATTRSIAGPLPIRLLDFTDLVMVDDIIPSDFSRLERLVRTLPQVLQLRIAIVRRMARVDGDEKFGESPRAVPGRS